MGPTPFFTTMRRDLPLIISVLLLLSFVSLSFASDLRAEQAFAATPNKFKRLSVYDKVGNWEITSLNGKKLSFSDCKGKVIFLNFWATWCVPCLKEMPDIEKLYQDLKEEDVVFLLISQEEENTVRSFLKKHPFNLPLYLTAKKPPEIFKIRKLPMTYLLDRQGGIAFRVTGMANWADSAYGDFLRKLTRR
jgi:thiol-disulfide isomerase/thioredoxin